MRTPMMIAVAALSSAFATTDALAWPVDATAPHVVGPTVHLVQNKPDKKPPEQPHKKQSPNKYKPGERYDHAPKGWRKHAKRPPNWKTRGCVIVGPVWFCP